MFRKRLHDFPQQLPAGMPPKVVKMLAKQARGFRKESDDDVPLELLLEPQEKSEQAGQ